MAVKHLPNSLPIPFHFGNLKVFHEMFLPFQSSIILGAVQNFVKCRMLELTMILQTI